LTPSKEQTSNAAQIKYFIVIRDSSCLHKIQDINAAYIDLHKNKQAAAAAITATIDHTTITIMTSIMINSIHSPADSLVLSSSFDSIDSLSPPPTPGRKRSYYPDQLSPMPEFFSSNGSPLSADHLLVEVQVMSEEEEAGQMARRPLPSFVLHPKSSFSTRTNMKLQLDHLDQIPPLPYLEPSPAPPKHQRMAFASLPRLPSLSEHNSTNVRSSSIEEFVLKPEHKMVVVDNGTVDVMSGRERNKNSKLPSFQSKGMDRKEDKEGRRNNLVARSA
jgi:hypothetical protein